MILSFQSRRKYSGLAAVLSVASMALLTGCSGKDGTAIEGNLPADNPTANAPRGSTPVDNSVINGTTDTSGTNLPTDASGGTAVDKAR